MARPLTHGPLEPSLLPSNPCLTLLPCVPSLVNTHLAFKRLQVRAFPSLHILNLWIPFHISSPSCYSSASHSYSSAPLLGVPLPTLPTAATSTPPLIHAPLACPSLAAIAASAPRCYSSAISLLVLFLHRITPLLLLLFLLTYSCPAIMVRGNSTRPSNMVASFVLHNTKDAGDDWLPYAYNLNDWIIMKGSAKGPHRLPKNKRGDLLHEWK